MPSWSNLSKVTKKRVKNKRNVLNLIKKQRTELPLDALPTYVMNVNSLNVKGHRACLFLQVNFVSKAYGL